MYVAWISCGCRIGCGLDGVWVRSRDVCGWMVGCGCGWMLRVGDWMWMLKAHVRMCVLSCVICVLVCILLHSYLQHRCFSISCFICNLFCDFLNTWQFLQHICCSISCFICHLFCDVLCVQQFPSTDAAAYRASFVMCVPCLMHIAILPAHMLQHIVLHLWFVL